MQFSVLLRNFRPRAIPLYIHTGLGRFWGAVSRANRKFAKFPRCSRRFHNFTGIVHPRTIGTYKEYVCFQLRAGKVTGFDEFHKSHRKKQIPLQFSRNDGTLHISMDSVESQGDQPASQPAMPASQDP